MERRICYSNPANSKGVCRRIRNDDPARSADRSSCCRAYDIISALPDTSCRSCPFNPISMSGTIDVARHHRAVRTVIQRNRCRSSSGLLTCVDNLSTADVEHIDTAHIDCLLSELSEARMNLDVLDYTARCRGGIKPVAGVRCWSGVHALKAGANSEVLHRAAGRWLKVNAFDRATVAQGVVEIDVGAAIAGALPVDLPVFFNVVGGDKSIPIRRRATEDNSGDIR